MFGGEWRDVSGDFPHHPRVGFPCDVAAPKMLRQRHDAERDRHPTLYARLGRLLRRIALDSYQFGRAATDIEQDRAAAFWIEQRRAADHRERRLGLAVNDFEADAGFGRDTVAEA